MSSPIFSVNVQQVDDVFSPSCVTSPTSSSIRLTPASGLPPTSPKRNRPIEFDDDEELRRPPSLYVHNPYGPGQMLRLKPFHEIMAEMSAAVNAAAAAASAASATTAQQLQQESNRSDVSGNVKNAKTVSHTNENTEEACECEDENAESQEEDSGSPLTGCSQRQQGQNGKRRRRQKKPRKNRSASLESESGERVSVCLDYLKGVCNRKRSRCKFAHPPLSLTSSPAPSTPCSCPLIPMPCVCPRTLQPIPVCAGYAMMGHCSYGSTCAEAHPQAHLSYQSMGIPVYPTAWPMPAENSRAAARRVSEVSNASMWSEGSSLSEENYYRTPSPLSFGHNADDQNVAQQQPVSCPPAFLRAWRDVNAWLGGTCFQNFDYTLAHVFNVLYDSASGLTLERLLPAIFGKAIDNYERLARVLAALCERLCALLTEEQQQEFKTQLTRLAETVLTYVPEPNDSDERIVNMARKLRGTAVFVGELFTQGLMTGPSLQNLLDFITQRAAAPSDIGALFTELGCLVLNICGHVAGKVLHVEQAVNNLNASVAFHQAQQRRGSMQHPGGMMGMNANSNVNYQQL